MCARVRTHAHNASEKVKEMRIRNIQSDDWIHAHMVILEQCNTVHDQDMLKNDSPTSLGSTRSPSSWFSPLGLPPEPYSPLLSPGEGIVGRDALPPAPLGHFFFFFFFNPGAFLLTLRPPETPLTEDLQRQSSSHPT